MQINKFSREEYCSLTTKNYSLTTTSLPRHDFRLARFVKCVRLFGLARRGSFSARARVAVYSVGLLKAVFLRRFVRLRFSHCISSSKTKNSNDTLRCCSFIISQRGFDPHQCYAPLSYTVYPVKDIPFSIL